MLVGAPRKPAGNAQPSECAHEDIFFDYKKHSVKHAKYLMHNPEIILADNPSSNVFFCCGRFCEKK